MRPLNFAGGALALGLLTGCATSRALRIAAVSLVATWIPTRRALRIGPMVALREE